MSDDLSARQTTRRRYKNPPIDEAVCEFRFRPGMEWDWTIPGKLHSAVESDYDGKPQLQGAAEVGAEIRRDGGSHLRYDQGPFRMLLFTQDEKRAIGVGADMLSIHMLRPYQSTDSPDESGWHEFRPRIAAALRTYWSVARPLGVQQISIRYVNRIIFPKPVVNLEDYLRCTFPSVPGLPDHINSYTSRTDYAYDDGTNLVITQGTIATASGNIGFLLDIDVVSRSHDVASLSHSLQKVDALRHVERNVFEAAITDNARELFDVGY